MNITDKIQCTISGRSGATLSFISCLIGGYLMDKFGRKILLAFVYVVFAIGWMMTAKKETFLIGRFLGSLAIGMYSHKIVDL